MENLFFQGLGIVAHGLEALLLGVEEEDGALEVDKAFQLFGFLTGALVDLHYDLPHFGDRDFTQEPGVGDTEDKLADFPPFFDELDVFDFSVREDDGIHLALPPGENVPFETPRKLHLLGEETELADDMFPAEGIGGRALEIDIYRVGEHHVRRIF